MSEVSEVKITKELVTIAAQNGISRKTLERRIYNLHWEPHRAATEEIDCRHHKTGAWERWKDRAVVSHNTFRQRLHRGKSEEEAALEPLGR